MPKVGRILGFDYGTKRIGVAISDLSMKIANPYGVLAGNFTNYVTVIHGQIIKEAVCALVIGYPIMMNASVGARAQSAHQFARNLVKEGISLPIFLQDERFTTWGARQAMIDTADLTRKAQAGVKDKVSAALILQRTLDTINPSFL